MIKQSFYSGRVFIAALGVATAACVSGCGSSAPDPAGPAMAGRQEPSAVTVTIAEGAVGKGPAAYGVNPLVVAPGTTVTWTNNDTAPHTSTSDAGSTETWDSGTLNTGQSFSHTFSNPGTFPYHCTIHGAASMSGVVQVSAASPSPSPSATPAATPSATPAATPSATPAATPNVTPSATPTSAPSVQPTAQPGQAGPKEITDTSTGY